MEIVLPELGNIGSFRMLMYRGIGTNKNHIKYSSDPGDYGRGEYWTNSKEFAADYGEVLEKIIELENVYYIPKVELIKIIDKYQTCKMHLGSELRLKGAQALTDYYKNEKGVAALLTFGYETFDIYGICIFKD